MAPVIWSKAFAIGHEKNQKLKRGFEPFWTRYGLCGLSWPCVKLHKGGSGYPLLDEILCFLQPTYHMPCHQFAQVSVFATEKNIQHCSALRILVHISRGFPVSDQPDVDKRKVKGELA
jgi:hypothetical protein